MPWHIVADSSECPASKPFAVIKNSDGSLAGCHPTKAAAQKQMAALYAKEPMMNEARPPRDNIVRALFPGAEVRDAEDGNGTLFGHFARFNEWTRIDSHFEGTFMERIAPGTFAKTFDESRGRVRITLNHGQDPELGDKPIAVPEVLEEDGVGARYEAPLLDGVPPLVVSGLRNGQYGASFRFRVTREDYDRKAKVSDHNPEGLPERTIREVELYEFGPVTYPAYAGATAGVRSLTDDYVRHLIPPDAPSVDAGASPHLEPERRDDPEPSADTPVETSTVADISGYHTLDEMGARTRELDAEIKRLSEVPGILPDHEQADFDDKVAERAKLDHAMTAWRNRLAQVRTGPIDDPEEPTYSPPNVNVVRRQSESDVYDVDEIEKRARNPEQRGQFYRDNALRATEIAQFPNEQTDEPKSRDKIAKMLDNVDSPEKHLARRILLTGSPVYRRAFNKILASGGTMTLTPEEQRGTALAVGVDGTGGFAVPFAFDPTVIAIGSHQGAINPYRANCRVVPIVGTDTWNPVTATAVVATRTTEAAAATEQGPTFAQGANGAYIVKRVQAQVTFSIEMGQDRPDLASEMARLISEAKDNEEEASFAVGPGTTTTSLGVIPPNGTSNMYTYMDTAGSLTLAAADAYAVEAALPVRWRFGARWVMNRGNLRKFQALETTGGILFGGYQYPFVGTPAIDSVGNTGLRLLGYPVDESPSAPTAATSHICIATLFAPQTYIIVDRVGMSVELIPNIINSSALATGQRAIYAIWRNHAAPLIADAGRVLGYKT